VLSITPGRVIVYSQLILVSLMVDCHATCGFWLSWQHLKNATHMMSVVCGSYGTWSFGPEPLQVMVWRIDHTIRGYLVARLPPLVIRLLVPLLIISAYD
jgi:hypothetical protein